MRTHWILILALCAATGVQAQQAQQKAFWSEDFSSGRLPEGWAVADSSGTGKCEWLVTDQPYPGSFQFNQQAPPIASGSRGYHLQYRPGVITGEEVTKWNQRREYPDAYVQTAPIDCRGKDQVLLTFQHAFRWNNWFTREKNAGLFVEVSNDNTHWTCYEVTASIPAVTSVHTPVTEELNITEVAANQPAVSIRFFWKGIFSWYWMIDDIALTEPLDTDVALVALTSHRPEGNTFTQSDTLRVKIKNVGSRTLDADFVLKAVIDGRNELTATVPAAAHPVPFNAEAEVSFPPVPLEGLGSHTIRIAAELPGDRRSSNDTLETKLYASEMTLGDVTAFRKISPREFEFESNYSKIKVAFHRDDIFRIWLAPDGEYTNPAADEIVVDYGFGPCGVKQSETRAYYKFQTRTNVLRVYKKPLRFALYDKNDKTCVWEELSPLTFGTKTYQRLKRQPDEYFFGCGMQNGYFSHRDKDVLIEVGGGWDDGARSNPAPFFMSSKGWGAFRNTFTPGKYAFRDTLNLSHNENRFDCFFFTGSSMKDVLNRYTDITGKPFMPAMWMLTMGDANCYNKPEQRTGWPQTTPDVIELVADKYLEYDMPRGWILPNDGYGCGYVQLDSVVQELQKRGIKTGLWTENGVDKIATEVGTYGSRLCKLDVAWVGDGYEFALNGARAAFEGIEKNSNERGFVWTVCGWAGTQRYATVWSGDQSGNWEYIRFHIPTLIGSGLSAQNAATGDVDGIFGGSARTYTRDLQWKCFTPILMGMSGWAEVNKQPWNYGEPYTAINREFLRLKMRMNPYYYSYCHEAHTTGVPTVRGMVLEFPDDTVTRGTQTQYQFMSGEWLLVAPVYTKKAWGTVRDSIYFAKGAKWFDYWNGKEYEGGTWLDTYKCALDKLPVFVRGGAIVPLYPQMNYVWERPADTLTLQVWPSGKSQFCLYEDDQITREYRDGKFAETWIRVSAPEAGAGETVIRVDAAEGDFTGRLKERAYVFDVQASGCPEKLTLNGKALPLYYTALELNEAGEGYYFDSDDRGGRLTVKVAPVSTDKPLELKYAL